MPPSGENAGRVLGIMPALNVNNYDFKIKCGKVKRSLDEQLYKEEDKNKARTFARGVN